MFSSLKYQNLSGFGLQGTGLGSRLSYDIIKKNDREIKVEAKEGERAEFIIKQRSSAKGLYYQSLIA